jgi:15-cis-phytoene desaturase
LKVMDVAIAGTGLAGLSCAMALRGSGPSVAVFEADSLAGGRAASRCECATGDVVDLGPHILLSEYRNVRALLRRLGTSDRIALQPGRLIRLRDGADGVDMHLHQLPPQLHWLPGFARVVRRHARATA